jgi:hypothetical protein
MSKIEVNTITQQCGPSLTVGGGACKSVTLDATTVTLGRCGATVSLASGATQTGFGRTGTVDWCTTAKTAPFTGVSGNGYFINTSCGAVTVTLPATPTAGDIISIKDYARTAATNNINFCRNGSKMDGNCANSSINTNGDSTTLIYVDGTQGWTSILDNTTNQYGAAYITATGGTITTSGDYKIHTFTSDGCFSVSAAGNPAGSDSVDYLVVAGGGGGGFDGGGGGGGGGFRLSNSTCMPAPLTSPLANPTGLPVSVTTYPITVGAGGTCNPNGLPTACTTGSNSIFSTIISAGGGGAGSNGIPSGGAGGSGGGSGRNNISTPGGGTGNTPPTSPPQGSPGNYHIGGGIGGGGGGADPLGAIPVPSNSGDGGNGSYVVSSGFAGANGTPGPVGSTSYFSGGGVGGHNPSDSPGASQIAGAGGGGGQAAPGGVAGTVNTGGGGGAGDAAGPIGYTGGAGGSGIVIIRYKFQ